MEPEFITYQKFNDIALANELTELLKKHAIEYYVDEQSMVFNPTLMPSDELSREYAVKIKATDFEQVNEFLQKENNVLTNDVERDYYLFDFTDDELMEVVTKADEWSAFDNVLARKILAERGKPISEEELSNLNEQRIKVLKTPDEPQNFWITIGYMCAALGGLLGIFIGWHLSSYKKTLPNGEKVFEYSETDRRHGKRIFYLSIIVFSIFFIYKLIMVYKDPFGY